MTGERVLEVRVMADEGLRARAEQVITTDEYLIGIFRLIRAAQEKIREEDCKAVCWLCASDSWKTAELVRHEWLHCPVNPVYEGDAVFFKCNAAAIRNLAEKEK